jgi:hypothetical protein
MGIRLWTLIYVGLIDGQGRSRNALCCNPFCTYLSTFSIWFAVSAVCALAATQETSKAVRVATKQGEMEFRYRTRCGEFMRVVWPTPGWANLTLSDYGGRLLARLSLAPGNPHT